MRADALVGQILASRYRVRERLGAGSMGTVFRAEHVKIGRSFALKVLHPQLLANPKARRRFQREADLAGKLSHPNVAGVLDVGVTLSGLHYLVMELASGRSLSELIDAGAPMPPERVCHLVRQMCEGLHHAHEHGLIHRDFKPDNVIVEHDGYGIETARIVDFGIAIPFDDVVWANERERLTTAGVVLGTPQYMPPEHAMAAPIDHRVDLFALGVIVYEMLTGKLPFDGEGVDVLRANVNRPTPRMNRRAPLVTVDPLLEAFTRALLDKSRDARLPSAKAARELLDLIESDRPAAAKVLGVTLPGEAAPASRPATAPRAPAAEGPRARDRDRLAAHAAVAATAPVDTAATAAVSATPSTEMAPLDPTGWRDRAGPRAGSELGLIEDDPRLRRSHRQAGLAIGAALCGALCIALVAIYMLRERATATAASTPTVAARAAPAQLSAHRPGTTGSPRPDPSPAAVSSTTASVPPLDAGDQRTVARAGAVRPPSRLVPGPAPAAAAPALAPAVTAPSVTAPAVTAPAPAPAGETPAPPGDPSNAAIARLYVDVGQRLRQLEADGGGTATADLWSRYRFIRIHDAFFDRAIRHDISDRLVALDEEIEARSRSSVP